MRASLRILTAERDFLRDIVKRTQSEAERQALDHELADVVDAIHVLEQSPHGAMRRARHDASLEMRMLR